MGYVVENSLLQSELLAQLKKNTGSTELIFEVSLTQGQAKLMQHLLADLG